MKEKSIYPEGIIDKKRYDEYVVLKNKLDSTSLKTLETLDGDTVEVSLMTPVHFFRGKFEDVIGVDLCEKIIKEDIPPIRKLMGEMTQVKNKAFGRKWAKGTTHLLDTRKAELIELFGRFFTIKEVHKLVVKEWGGDVATVSLEKFRIDNINQIEERQKEYLRSHSNVRLSHKRSRLDELTYLYSDRKEIYDTKNKQKDDYKLLLSTLEQIRKEVEGDILTVDGKLEIDIQSTLNVHVQQEALKDLNINNIIISRVAARMGVNPYYILNSLNKSFYSKFSRFKHVSDEEMEENILYPTSAVYDWDEIKKNEGKRKEREEKMKKFEDAVIVKPDEEETVGDFKNNMIRSLKERQVVNNDVINRVNEVDKEFRMKPQDKLKEMLNEKKRKYNKKNKPEEDL